MDPIDFLLATAINSLLLANVLLTILVVIYRYTDNWFCRMNFFPLACSIACACVLLGGMLFAYVMTTGTLPATKETQIDSLMRFFPRLEALPASFRLTLEVMVFACLLIPIIFTCRHFSRGQKEARTQREDMQRQLKKALVKINNQKQEIISLKAKNSGLYAGYLYISGNHKVPAHVQDEFLNRIHAKEKAYRKKHLEQQTK